MPSQDDQYGKRTSADHGPPGEDPGHARWHPSIVFAVANVLAATDWPGLTNREIDRLLRAAAITDTRSGSKRDRLGSSILDQVQREGTDEPIMRLLSEAMMIGNYVSDPTRFQTLREQLNKPLSIIGTHITDQGILTARDSAAATLDDVARLTNSMRVELDRRDVHSEVLRFCNEELIRNSIFHAVFEAVKGVADRLRRLSGLTLDGGKLIDECFRIPTIDKPLICINDMTNESQESEHKGFANLLRGVFGTFRNPPAHTPRATGDWQINRTDALDLFCALSFIHRRLDRATVNRTSPFP